MSDEAQDMVVSTEETDAVVVGTRVSGSATAISLSRRGARVIGLDRTKFPSDTLSTHVLFATGVAELKWLGALDRVRAVGAPPWRVCHPNTVVVDGQRLDPHAPMSAVDGIDYGLCTRRPGLDHALVETARDAGADMREQCTVTDVLWQDGRAVGVRYRTLDGELHDIRAKLVVGADGRRSTMAKLLGVEKPYRWSEAGRGLVFMYVKDSPDAKERDRVRRWQVGDTAGFFFPNDDGVGTCLFMPPKEEIKQFRKDPEGTWARKLEQFPELKKRLEGTEPITKLRSADDTHAYFRISSGPGWALVGDASHFKDPVIAQGIRDAMRFGRLLGDAVGHTLSDPEELDKKLFEWELNRDRECLPSYYLARRETRTHPVNQLEAVIYKELHRNVELAQGFVKALADEGIHDEFIDVVARKRDPRKFFTPQRLVRWTWTAARQPGADRRALAKDVLEELRYEVGLRRDLAMVYSGRRADYRRLQRLGQLGTRMKDALRGRGNGAQAPPSEPAPASPASPPAASAATPANGKQGVPAAKA